MCHQVKTIAKNCNGNLSFCADCRRYHLTFNNIFIELSRKEMRAFKKFVGEIKMEYWENKYDGQVMERKIPIPTMQSNLVLLFNKQELESLKELIFWKKRKSQVFLSVLDIDYTLFLN